MPEPAGTDAVTAPGEVQRDRRRPTVLVCSDYFRPGFKGGGPATSISNIAAQLGSDVTFVIVTRDRDLGDPAPYAGIEKDVFLERHGAKVMYVAERDATARRFLTLLKELAPDVLYLNSVLSRRFSLRPLLAARLGMLAGIISPSMKVVIAPRGEFAPGALSIKRRRKFLYLRLVQALGLWRGVQWQASSEYEAEDIRRRFGGRSVSIAVAPDLAAPLPPAAARSPKESGRADFVFLGRISPIKNLEHSIRALRSLRGKASLTVYGPIEDAAYWRKCEAAAATLPQHISVGHGGVLTPDRIAAVLSAADALLLPSLGENFAQVVIEALSCGCPVVLSDRTPWRDLQRRGIGWDLPLDDLSRTIAALQCLVDMDERQHRQYRSRARAFAAGIVEDQDLRNRTLSLFKR